MRPLTLRGQDDLSPKGGILPSNALPNGILADGTLSTVWPK